MSSSLPLPPDRAVAGAGPGLSPDRAIASRRVDSLPARVTGVFRAPRTTFAALARSPRWADVLALSVAVTFLCGALFLETETGRLALLDQWERTAVAFGQPVDDARYAALARASEHGVPYAGLTALASGPMLVFGTSLLLFAAARGMRPGAATYAQVVAIVAHAGVILALRQVVAMPLDYARETFATPISLNVFFPLLDETSPLARFLGIVDLFVVWWAAALAIGMAVLCRRRVWPMAAAFICMYVGAAALLALVMAMTGDAA